MADDLKSSAMLVAVSIGKPSATKYDKKISREVADQYKTLSSVGRYTRMVIPKDALKEIIHVEGLARAVHYKYTLPWYDDGYRILKASAWMEFTAELRKVEALYEQARRDFVARWPEILDEAEKQLNGMFNRADYKTAAQVNDDFYFRVIPKPIPEEAKDFRVNLHDDIVANIQATMADQRQSANQAMLKSVWERAYEVVNHIVEVMNKNGKARIYETLTGNVDALCDLLPALNVTDDPKLAALAEDMRRKLASYSAEVLRDRPWARQELADNARDVLRTINSELGEPEPKSLGAAAVVDTPVVDVAARQAEVDRICALF